MNKQELRNRVLQHMRLLPVGEEPSVEDAELVEEVIDGVFAELVRKRQAGWPLTNIPQYVQLSMIKLVAFEVSGSFGREQNLTEREVALRGIGRFADARQGCDEYTKADDF
ncbi:MAG: hypothetical protein ACR2QH_10505 [Geminicoccaceae bacterium]